MGNETVYMLKVGHGEGDDGPRPVMTMMITIMGLLLMFPWVCSGYEKAVNGR